MYLVYRTYSDWEEYDFTPVTTVRTKVEADISVLLLSHLHKKFHGGDISAQSLGKYQTLDPEYFSSPYSKDSRYEYNSQPITVTSFSDEMGFTVHTHREGGGDVE